MLFKNREREEKYLLTHPRLIGLSDMKSQDTIMSDHWAFLINDLEMCRR
jgi:hypothetical protein